MSVSAADRLVRILEMKSQPGEPPRTIEDDLALLKLLREQHAEIERLKIEREKTYDLGYDKGVRDTLLDYADAQETYGDYYMLDATRLLREQHAEIERLKAALQDIARQPEGDEESAQAVAKGEFAMIERIKISRRSFWDNGGLSNPRHFRKATRKGWTYWRLV